MTEFQASLLLALVGFMALILLVLAIGQRRQKSPGFITAEVLQAAEALGEAIQHHVQVNAVLALMDQFQSRPELVHNLAGYAQQVVAAAFLHRINTLSSNLNGLEEALADARLKAVVSPSLYKYDVDRLEKMLPIVRAELEAANQAAQQFGLQSSTT